MTGFYITMGRYDIIAFAEFPGDEATANLVLSLGSGGNIRTDTLKAFPEVEYRGVITKVP